MEPKPEKLVCPPMKKRFLSIRAVKPSLTGSRSGVALILVLAFLVLITALVLAFFASVTLERSSAKSYANGATTKQLADSSVQTSMGIVRQATAGTATAGGSTVAWASQPGMIRTYDNSGNPLADYKLYSSDNMVVTQNTQPAIGTPPTYDPSADVDAAWKAKPSLFTDLNAPVIRGANDANYPIVDPSASGVVKGFSLSSNPPGYDSSKAASATNNPAPMPVKWLYLLADGSISAPTGADATGNVADWTGSGNPPTAANPIVSRIAFWTDDDSCKVNINTAAGDVWTDTAPAPGQPGNPGSFWDVPRVFSTFEKTYLAQNQPQSNEFQRYPGHPATTYLSTVFTNLTSPNIYQISPRVALGGSLGGTAFATNPITKDSDRLYASVDELLFKTSISPTRDTNAPLSAAVLKPVKFFLTALSRAPEVNLFNQPRIVTWPVSSTDSPQYRTPFDSLIAYCGTLNGYPYFFQRGDCNSQTADLPASASATGAGRNRALITYLRNMTKLPVPGFGGGTFLSKYPKDRDQILTEIFDYIRALNAQDQSVLGLNSFCTTGGTGTPGVGQIIPIADDIHSDSNADTLRGFGRFPTVREASIVFVGVGQTSGSNKSIPPDSPSQTAAGAIPDGKTRVQAFFTLNFFDPSQGYASCFPNFQVRVTGLDGFQWSGTTMGFPATKTVTMSRYYDTGNFGGYKGASTFIQRPTANPILWASGTTIDLATTTSATPTTFTFTGGDIKVEILDSTGANVLQALTINFSSTNPSTSLPVEFPVPELAPSLVDTGLTSDFRSLKTGVTSGAGGRFAGSGINTSFSTSSKTWLCGKDVVRSVEANTDLRLIAALKTVPSSYFSVVPDYYNTGIRMVHSIAECVNGAGFYPSFGCELGKFVPNADYGTGSGTPLSTTVDYSYSSPAPGIQPVASPIGAFPIHSGPLAFGMSGTNCVPVNGVYAGTGATAGTAAGYPPGDWDTGFSIVPDGPYINKADEGTITRGASGTQVPYFDNLASFTTAGGTFFSPNRQMPSAVMFGSLPTGAHENRPWQTLLFRPDPGGTPQHRGAQSPQDHLLLDLFWMPVVEPYAISDPFSTAGKINMNYQIVPFTYMVRDTGIRAVLKSEQILALANSDSKTYKSQNAVFPNRRSYLDLDQTLVGFQNRFASRDIFRSASEICNIWLVPQGQTYAGMQAFWNNNLLTGDNVRERPYANIYPRLTTKSNTYTVHYRVQTLKKVPSTAANQWVEGKDAVTAEQRGSSTFERYIDPSDTSIPDYATAASPPPIDSYYKFRIIETKQFTQ